MLFFSKEPANHFDWQLHATGKITSGVVESRSAESLGSISTRGAEVIDLDELYINLEPRGLAYGPYFRTIVQMRRGHAEVLARVDLILEQEEALGAYYLHPTMLDGCFQSLLAGLEDDDHFYMPVSIRKLTYYRHPSKLL